MNPFVQWLDSLPLSIAITIYGGLGILTHVFLFGIIGERAYKALWVAVFMLPVVIVPWVFLFFFPFAPLTALGMFGVFMLMGVYAIGYVIDVVF
jgi:hypothetical protein